eukprot:429289_1
MERIRRCIVRYSKGGCSSLCTRVRADRAVNEPDAYIYRSTNVSAYTTLQLQVNGSCINLEPGDACRIYYGWSQSDKNAIKSWGDFPNSNTYFYLNQAIDLPDASNADTVWIWLESHNNGTTGDPSADTCYWNNVVLRGILATQPPYNEPSASPTQPPSQSPSQYPTVNPSNTPSRYPTVNPSKTPTQ